ncbi:uncharacterized protein LOC119402317 [Rhipicephalus sanguineus]|uniref:uncharacterized protein LOC119402317 n=1 Tax=Rhipicephalus sanguineus TaxID=34632 RepID=UPI0020C44D72|nr:uncharacterized protein LOC119402317 [Rhipicephalus sanguineus]
MKAYAILALLLLGHLCHIQAATLNKPATSTDETTKLLSEKLFHSIIEHRDELLEALKGIDSTGDGTDDQFRPYVLATIISAIAGGAISAAVGAGVQKAINKD